MLLARVTCEPVKLRASISVSNLRVRFRRTVVWPGGVVGLFDVLHWMSAKCVFLELCSACGAVSVASVRTPAMRHPATVPEGTRLAQLMTPRKIAMVSHSLS